MAVDFTLPAKLARYHVGTDTIRDARTGEELSGMVADTEYVMFGEWFERKREEIQARAGFDAARSASILAEMLLASSALNWPS